MPADPQRAHGSPKSLTVATPASNSHGADSTLDDFDETLMAGNALVLERSANKLMN